MGSACNRKLLPRAVTSLLYFGDIGVHTAVIAIPHAGTTGKRERKRGKKKGKQGDKSHENETIQKL